MPIVLDGSTGITTPDVETNTLNGGQLAGMRNKIINGKMDIAQRGTSFSVAASGTAYTVDRWKVYNGSTAALTVTQQADAPSDNQFQNSLRVAVTTADTSLAAGEVVAVEQSLEGYNARDLLGRTFAASFRVRSSKTGVHCVAFRSGATDRAYVVEFTVNSANTWESKTVLVQGGLPSTGTWTWANGVGVIVSWALGSGSTFHTTANAWQSGNFLATANQVNCLDTIGNIFAITGVQIEVGDKATPFEHRPIGTELALCQRYFHALGGATGNLWAVAGVSGTTSSYAITQFPTTMRAAPGLVVVGTGFTAQDNNLGPVSATISLNSASPSYALMQYTHGSNLTGNAVRNLVCSNATSFLQFSAEL